MSTLGPRLRRNGSVYSQEQEFWLWRVFVLALDGLGSGRVLSGAVRFWWQNIDFRHGGVEAWKSKDRMENGPHIFKSEQLQGMSVLARVTSVIRRRGWCVGRGWVLAGEKEVDFTRKISPRLAILRALIRRDLHSDWSNSLDFGVVIRLEPRCQATQALPY